MNYIISHRWNRFRSITIVPPAQVVGVDGVVLNGLLRQSHASPDLNLKQNVKRNEGSSSFVAEVVNSMPKNKRTKMDSAEMDSKGHLVIPSQGFSIEEGAAQSHLTMSVVPEAGVSLESKGILSIQGAAKIQSVRGDIEIDTQTGIRQRVLGASRYNRISSQGNT